MSAFLPCRIVRKNVIQIRDGRNRAVEY